MEGKLYNYEIVFFNGITINITAWCLARAIEIASEAYPNQGLKRIKRTDEE